MPGKSDKFRDVVRLIDRGWLTLPAVARIIGVHYHTILKMRRRGQIGAVKVGGVFRVYDHELIRFLVEGNYLDEGLAERIMAEEVYHDDTG